MLFSLLHNHTPTHYLLIHKVTFMLCLLILCIEAAGAVSLTCLSESEVHLKTPTLEPSVSLCLLMLECKMNAKKKKNRFQHRGL